MLERYPYKIFTTFNSAAKYTTNSLINSSFYLLNIFQKSNIFLRIYKIKIPYQDRN